MVLTLSTENADTLTDTLERAATKPAQYLKLALDDETSGGRAAGLILTKEDILKIKRYERRGLGLPTTPTSVSNQLGFSKSDISGLEVSDFTLLYQSIYEHALMWNPIEKDVKLVGVSLDNFSGNLILTGERLIAAINTLTILSQLVLTVADLDEETIEGTDWPELSAEDLKILQALPFYLQSVKVDVERCQGEATQLKNALEIFSAGMTTQLIPLTNEKLTLARKNNLAHGIETLKSDIQQLESDIKDKEREYKKATANIAWGGFGGPIGVAITGGIFGSQAEQIRKEKNKLIERKQQKISELAIKVPLLAAMEDVVMFFQDLNFSLLDAEQGAKNLEDLWSVMVKLIDLSSEELKRIDNSRQLLFFVLDFEKAIAPWKTIKGYTHQLLVVFSEALEEYKILNAERRSDAK